MKKIKPEDSVTITTTYGELAAAYAILGRENGETIGSKSLFRAISELIDPNQKVYREQYDAMLNSPDYYTFQPQWLAALFSQETEQQKQIKELEATIKKASEQLSELKKGI